MTDIVCPFCGEKDFDLIGLKRHLTVGECEAFIKVADYDGPNVSGWEGGFADNH